MGPFARVDERFKKVVLAAGLLQGGRGSHGGAESQAVDLCWPAWLSHIWLGIFQSVIRCEKIGHPLTTDFLVLIWASAYKRSLEPQPQTPQTPALPVDTATLPMSPPNPEPSIVFLCSDCEVVFRNMPEFCWFWWSVTPWRRNEFWMDCLIGKFQPFAKGGGHFSTRLPICCLSNWDDSSIHDQEGKDIDDWNPF